MRVTTVRARTAGVGALLMCSVLGVLTTAPARAAEAGCAATWVIAHRGVLTGGTTENTLRAMEQAALRGAEVEIDLRTTADGRVVVMHDKSLVRTTNGRGLVADLSAAYIRSVRADDGQRVLFARAALTFIRDHPGTEVVLDLKALTTQSNRALAGLVAELGVADQVSAISFRDGLIAGFRAANPGVGTYKILPDLPDPESAATYGGVHVPGALVTDEWVASMRDVGVPFNLRVTDDPALWALAVRVGADWVMTDDVDGWHAWCANA